MVFIKNSVIVGVFLLLYVDFLTSILVPVVTSEFITPGIISKLVEKSGGENLFHAISEREANHHRLEKEEAKLTDTNASIVRPCNCSYELTQINCFCDEDFGIVRSKNEYQGNTTYSFKQDQNSYVLLLFTLNDCNVTVNVKPTLRKGIPQNETIWIPSTESIVVETNDDNCTWYFQYSNYAFQLENRTLHADSGRIEAPKDESRILLYRPNFLGIYRIYDDNQNSKIEMQISNIDLGRTNLYLHTTNESIFTGSVPDDFIVIVAERAVSGIIENALSVDNGRSYVTPSLVTGAGFSSSVTPSVETSPGFPPRVENGPKNVLGPFSTLAPKTAVCCGLMYYGSWDSNQTILIPTNAVQIVFFSGLNNRQTASGFGLTYKISRRDSTLAPSTTLGSTLPTPPASIDASVWVSLEGIPSTTDMYTLEQEFRQAISDMVNGYAEIKNLTFAEGEAESQNIEILGVGDCSPIYCPADCVAFQYQVNLHFDNGSWALSEDDLEEMMSEPSLQHFWTELGNDTKVCNENPSSMWPVIVGVILAIFIVAVAAVLIFRRLSHESNVIQEKQKYLDRRNQQILDLRRKNSNDASILGEEIDFQRSTLDSRRFTNPVPHLRNSSNLGGGSIYPDIEDIDSFHTFDPEKGSRLTHGFHRDTTTSQSSYFNPAFIVGEESSDDIFVKSSSKSIKFQDNFQETSFMGAVGPSKERKKTRPGESEGESDQDSTKNKYSRGGVRFALAEAEDLSGESDSEDEILRQRRERLKHRRGTKFNAELDVSSISEGEKDEDDKQEKKDDSNEDESQNDPTDDDARAGIVKFDVSKQPNEELDSEDQILAERSEKLKLRRGTKFVNGDIKNNNQDKESDEDSDEVSIYSHKGGAVQFNLPFEETKEDSEYDSDEEILRRRREKLKQRRGTKFNPGMRIEEEEDSDDTIGIPDSSYSIASQSQISSGDANKLRDIMMTATRIEKTSDEDNWSRGYDSLGSSISNSEKILSDH